MLTLPTAYLSSSALVHNISRVRAFAPQSQILAMVKANAYGHDLAQTASVFRECGIEAFGVARIDEALTLRQLGFNETIVLLGGILDREELQLACEANIDIVIHRPEQADLLIHSGLHARIWLKVNTGMNRLGLSPEETLLVYKHLIAQAHLHIVCIMTHFASAETADGSSLQAQVQQLDRLCANWQVPKSLANSAAIMQHPQTHRDIVRPGIMLYGISPFPEQTGTDLGLKPAMRLVAPLCANYLVKQGEQVGYNGLFTCPENMPIGIVRMGYGDGYPRYLRHPACVWLEGHRLPIIGRVSMDLLAIDLRPYPKAPIGAPIECWGEHLPIEVLAHAADTSPYELASGLTPRVLHVLVD